MKRFSYLLIAGALVFSLFVWGCGKANQWGASFDISRICADAACTKVASMPEVSLSANSPLTVYLELHNRMDPGDETGQVARTKRIEVDYVTPNDQPIIRLESDFVANVEPGAKLIVPSVIFDYTQLEYVRDRQASFPDTPFQVNCRITVFYSTTAGKESSVERVLSIQVNS